MNKSESARIIDRITERVAHYLEQFFPDGKRSMVLGVSGGPDSMSLLYILSRLEVDLLVVHCNYQLRGEDSDKDQDLVEQTASMWGFDVFSARLDPSEAENTNFQGWARKRRYEIFRDLKKEYNHPAIATAHHQDDQLETIIQKILRGAGLTAWQGMKIWNGELFRPLLDFSKAELLQFASANEIPYRLDNSNEESTYARNFLRNGWFPILDDLFPGWRENLLKIPDRAREHEAVVKSLIHSMKPDENSIDRSRLISLDPEVRKPLLLQILKSIDPDATVSSGTLKNLDELESLQTGKKLKINNSWQLIRDRDRFRIRKPMNPAPVAIELSSGDLQQTPLEIQGFRIEMIKWEGKINTDRLQVDADKLDWPVRLRPWKSGDSMNPFGMKGSQNISDLLTNKKISAALKETAGVLETAGGEIAAVLFPGDVDRIEEADRAEGVEADRQSDMDSAGDAEPGDREQPEGMEEPGVIADWARCTDGTEHVLTVRRSMTHNEQAE